MTSLFERLRTDTGAAEHHRLESAPPSPQGLEADLGEDPDVLELQEEQDLKKKSKSKKKKKSKSSIDKGKDVDPLERPGSGNGLGLEEQEEDADAGQRGSTSVEYPPVNDEEAEARRIRETLAHWDMMEKQRRKAARESRAARTPSTVIQDLAGYVTSFGASSNARPPSGAVKLRNRESKNPFADESKIQEDEEEKEKKALGHSREATDATTTTTSSTDAAEDPFKNPPPSSTLAASTAPLLQSTSSSQSAKSDTLQVPSIPRRRRSSSRSSSSPTPLPPPPPKEKHKRKSTAHSAPARPLDLPEPKMVVPNASGIGHWRRAHEERQREMDMEDELDEDHVRGGRWWTDLFCGCRESHRREEQDGRTNPFE